MTEVPLTTQEHLVREEKRAFNTHGDGINGATSRLRLMVEPANLDCLREALSHYSGGTAQVTTRALTITSFDTDDRRFRRRGIAMDFECDGRRCAQTLRAKRSDGGENVLRTEWEADTSTPQPRLDMITDLELRERVGFLRDDALVSLFMTRIERQEQVVTCQENNLSNLVLATLDVGEIDHGPQHVAEPRAQMRKRNDFKLVLQQGEKAQHPNHRSLRLCIAEGLQERRGLGVRAGCDEGRNVAVDGRTIDRRHRIGPS